MNKLMLITGSSSGIGKSCAEYFSEQYKIVGISRNPARFTSEQGDLTDINFRNYILDKYCPDVFINNAGIVSNNTSDVMQINSVAAGHLLVEFYKKMKQGNIINISSWSTNITANNSSNYQLISYKASKKIIKSLSQDLNHKKEKNINITNLELQIVDTPLINRQNIKINPDLYNNFDWSNSVPITTQYVAETIDWLLKQPPYVTIENLTIANACKYPQAWLQQK